jgi:hypothetical protein
MKKCEKSEKKHNYIPFKLCRAHSAPSSPYGYTCDAEGGANVNYWSIMIKKVKRVKKAKKAKLHTLKTI